MFVQIKNSNGLSAIIVVSCVSKDLPHYPHPHNLVGTNCRDGVCTIRLKPHQNVVKYVVLLMCIICYFQVGQFVCVFVCQFSEL